MIQETKEQQQMYNLFRSFIYIFLIIELVMHMPVHTGSSIANSFLQMIARLGFFNSVVSCKIIELVTILITCAGTTARRSLKFDVRKMVVYPCAAGITLTVLCIFPTELEIRCQEDGCLSMCSRYHSDRTVYLPAARELGNPYCRLFAEPHPLSCYLDNRRDVYSSKP